MSPRALADGSVDESSDAFEAKFAKGRLDVAFAKPQLLHRVALLTADAGEYTVTPSTGRDEQLAPITIKTSGPRRYALTNKANAAVDVTGVRVQRADGKPLRGGELIAFVLGACDQPKEPKLDCDYVLRANDAKQSEDGEPDAPERKQFDGAVGELGPDGATFRFKSPRKLDKVVVRSAEPNRVYEVVITLPRDKTRIVKLKSGSPGRYITRTFKQPLDGVRAVTVRLANEDDELERGELLYVGVNACPSEKDDSSEQRDDPDGPTPPSCQTKADTCNARTERCIDKPPKEGGYKCACKSGFARYMANDKCVRMKCYCD